MTHAKFYFNRLMLTLISAIRASEPPRAWRTTKKAGPDRVKLEIDNEQSPEFIPNRGLLPLSLDIFQFRMCKIIIW